MIHECGVVRWFRSSGDLGQQLGGNGIPDEPRAGATGMFLRGQRDEQRHQRGRDGAAAVVKKNGRILCEGAVCAEAVSGRFVFPAAAAAVEALDEWPTLRCRHQWFRCVSGTFGR
jgi:hypothetical protein